MGEESAQRPGAVTISALCAGCYYYFHFPRDLLKHQYLNIEFLLPGALFLWERNYGSHGVGPEQTPWAGLLPSEDGRSGNLDGSKH